MKALVFENKVLRTVATALLSRAWPAACVGPTSPLQLRELAEPGLPGAEWLRLQTRLCGLCGSDYKQVFLNGSIDNPMTSLISFPQVLGHEVVGVVRDCGEEVDGIEPGDRVLLNPWLSCEPRGLEPCRWCAVGELAQCENFERGSLAPGIHHGNSADAHGGFAESLVAHRSQCFVLPPDITDEQAVLADPFSVSLHATLLRPPPDDGCVLVYGCGTLGLCQVAALRLLWPDCRVLAVARFPQQARLAARLGAHVVIDHKPELSLIERVADETKSPLRRPWRGLPMLTGGVDVVYDTVGMPSTLEVGLRVARPHAAVVVTGVEKPARFEWTPLYFKEIALVGSSGFGHETVNGSRRHAFEHYIDWTREGRLDLSPLITHRFGLAEYREAFMACRRQDRSEAVKVLFEFPA
jgi:threonine dehydrogenase-like Zn-dependent dehydrogenase